MTDESKQRAASLRFVRALALSRMPSADAPPDVNPYPFQIHRAL